MSHPINELTLKPVFLFGKFCMFTDMRVNITDLPNGIYKYDLRHSDEDWGEPVEVCDNVIVNFYGSILVKEKLPDEINFDEKELYLIGEYDFIEEPIGDMLNDPAYDGFFDIKTLYEYIQFNDETGWDIPINRIRQQPQRKYRIFISQPFTGKNDDEIIKQRRLITELYCHYKGWEDQMWNVKLINQHMPNDPFDKEENFRDNQHREFYRFCRSVGMMKDATDIIIFGDWKHSRGCDLEHEIISRYIQTPTALLDQIHDTSVNIVFNENLIDFCQNNPEYNDIFEQLYPEEFDKMHEVTDGMNNIKEE